MAPNQTLSQPESAFLASQRVARLSTVDERGQPFIVPICFAYIDGMLYSALDEKPKHGDPRNLKRVRNILTNPNVAVLVDRYTENWSALAFLMVRGTASLVEPGCEEHTQAVGALRAKYQQYQRMDIQSRPVIRIRLERTSSWGDLERQPDNRAEVLQLMSGRHSVRWYTDEPVTSDQVRTILEAGGWAPSPHGRQPWRFALITEPGTRHKLAEAMALEWDRQLRMDGQPEEIVQRRLQRSRDRLLRAPMIVILCLYLEDLDVYPDPDRQWAEETMAVQSLGACAENMLLAAHAIGLEGGWMCAPLFCPDVVREALGLQDSLIPHALLTFGYPQVHPPRRERFPLNELVAFSDSSSFN